MGTTKNTEDYSPEVVQWASWAKALAHPARLEIILFLSRQESCVCSAVVDQLDLAQSTVSQHLKALKQAGIIRGTISGTQVCYCLDPETWAQIRLGWNTLFDRCAPQLLCCPVDEPK